LGTRGINPALFLDCEGLDIRILAEVYDATQSKVLSYNKEE
jgi:hypothetical protein